MRIFFYFAIWLAGTFGLLTKEKDRRDRALLAVVTLFACAVLLLAGDLFKALETP